MKDDVTYRAPDVVDDDLSTNISWNRQRWGQQAGWSEHDGFGYQWGNGYEQRVGDISRLADQHLRPFVGDSYGLEIVELSPGAGRFTVELIRYASSLTVVDLNQAAIDVCRTRLQYYPTPVEFHTNDGQRLPMVEDESVDLFACYDSMVHMHPDVIRSYVGEAARILRRGGRAWLDHSGKGARDAGHRSAMTAEVMTSIAGECGLKVLDQRWRNNWDCISVLEK